MKSNLLIKIFSIACLWGLAMLFVSSCQSDKKETFSSIPQKTREEIPSFIDHEVTIYLTDSGRLKVELFAPMIAIYDQAKKPYRDLIEGVQVKNYSIDGKVVSQISSEYAIYWEKKAIWELSSNVKAINEDGQIFETELLFWDTKKKIVYSDEQIKITTSEKIIIGNEGFKANEDFTDYEIKKTNAIFNIPQESM